MWCNKEGDPTTYSGPVPSIESVAEGLVFASPDMLNYRHPDHFLSGNLNSCLENWRAILQDSPFQDFGLPIISHGEVTTDYFQPFQGTFLQQFCDSNFPPRKIFPNSKSCASFEGFITYTIMERVHNGSLNVIAGWEKLSPHTSCSLLPMNLKNFGMCYDYITDLPRYVDQDHYQTTFDVKIGYDHKQLNPSSSTYFGLEWGRWYFSYATLPFGWKASAYIYHTVGMAATHFIRSNGVPCFQYIDDRHAGKLRLLRACAKQFSNFQLAQMAAFVACSVLVSLGYFIGLKKKCLNAVYLCLVFGVFA